MTRLSALICSAFVALLLAAGLSAPANANPLAYYNQPFDTPNSAANAVVASINTYIPGQRPTTTCTGTTTSTCTGLRFVVSTTGLTTAAGVTATAMTVTNTSVVAVSQVFCQALGYAGTGNPVALNVVPGAGSFTFQIENTHASAALNATVPTVCFVYN